MNAAPQNNSTPDFDPLARAYRWMEYLSFGPMLERCRFHFLRQCAEARHALILGDGDGRFTARLIGANSKAQVDAVDASAAMLATLRRRANRTHPLAQARLRTIQADLRQWTPSGNDYDLVVSHFFLDCLTDDEVESLIARTLPHLTPDATWLISEFAIPDGRWLGGVARLMIRFLYFAFSKMTKLRITQLPDYAMVLTRHGFRHQEQRQFLNGLLVAEIWVRNDF